MDNLLQTYYDKRFLEILKPKLHLYEWAEKKPIPKNQGKVIQFNQWRAADPASTFLTETTPPTAFALSSRSLTATLVQMGRVAKVSDFVDMTAVSPVVESAVELLTDSARKTYERFLQQIIWRTDEGMSGKVNWDSAVLSARMSSQLSGTKFNGASTWGFKVMFATSVGRLSAVDKNSINISAQLSKSSISRVVAKLRSLDALRTMYDLDPMKVIASCARGP